MQYTSQNDWNNYLAHHGILGQKWGVRRYQNVDGSLTEAGRDRYTTGGDSSTNKRGWYSVHDYLPEDYRTLRRENSSLGKIQFKLASNGLASKTTMSQYNSELDAQKQADMQNAYKKVEALAMGTFGKNHDSGWIDSIRYVNPNYTKGKEWQNNCYSCSLAYCMRLRGYDVVSIADLDGETTYKYLQSLYSPTEYDDAVQSVEFDHRNDEKDAKEIEAMLLGYGDGAYGMFDVYWESGFGGHSLAFTVQDGKVYIVDAQNGSYTDEILNYVKRSKNLKCTRLDNLPITGKNAGAYIKAG